MYTPFSRAVLALGEPPPPLPAPRRVPAPETLPACDPLASWNLLPSKPDWSGGFGALWKPGEASARGRLKLFLRHAVSGYATGRNLPGEDGTSMLSPHLHFGEISPRSVWHAVRAAGEGDCAKTFLGELIWRDFSAYLLWHNPTLPEAPRCGRVSRGLAGGTTLPRCMPGSAAAPASPSSMQGSGSSGRRAGCTIVCA